MNVQNVHEKGLSMKEWFGLKCSRHLKRMFVIGRKTEGLALLLKKEENVWQDAKDEII